MPRKKGWKASKVRKLVLAELETARDGVEHSASDTFDGACDDQTDYQHRRLMVEAILHGAC